MVLHCLLGDAVRVQGGDEAGVGESSNDELRCIIEKVEEEEGARPSP